MNKLDRSPNKNFWKIGKEEYKKFLEIKLKRKTNIVSLLFGILLTALIILPPACFLFEIVELYWYKANTKSLFLAIAWGLLLLCNGLSSYITVKIVKSYEKDMPEVQSLDDKAIFFYQTLNVWFAVFTLIIMIFFWVSSI